MSYPPEGIRELDAEETALAYEVMAELRQGLPSPEVFVDQVDRRQRPHGYRLIAEPSEGRPVAIAGFRIVENLATGSHLYVDDLVTREVRGVAATVLV
jgi:hypothetical protein